MSLQYHYTTLPYVKPFGAMKMSQPTMYQFRIDEDEKKAAFAVFNEMGLKPAQAIRLFFRHVRKTHALPFPVEHIPNERTAKALLSNDYVGPFETVEDLFADLRK